MEFLEKDLEQIIFESDKQVLSDRGLSLKNGKLFRQLRIGSYGIADLVHAEWIHDGPWSCGTMYIDIIELKKDKIGISAFLQAVRYAVGIKNYLNNRRVSFDFNITITLIGSNLDTSGSLCLLPNLLNVDGSFMKLRFITYSYGINGLNFKEDSYFDLTDNGFKI